MFPQTLILILIAYCECANILYLIPFSSKSHYISLRPIGLELARRGHNVTVFTVNREDEPLPNYHQVMVDDEKIWDVIGGGRPNVFTMVDLPAENFHEKILWAGGLGFTEIVFKSKDVKEFLAKDNSFDLIISEQFFQEALLALTHKYEAPLVLVTTYGNCMRHNIITRNPLQLATVTSEFLDLKKPKSFFGRLRNLYFSVYEFLWWKFWYLEKQEALVRKYLPDLPKPVPNLYDIQRNASLILLNGHFSFDPPTAYLPNSVEVGGLHLYRSDKELPKDLKNILDNAMDGVVYISFGSNVRSTELPIEKRNAFLKVFKNIKQTVLWKWEDDSLDDTASNLLVRKWFPQKEIFAHPNVKVFISHGGLIGTQEAVFNAIPILGVPIYADQYNNLLLAEEHGFGKILQYHDITEGKLMEALTEMLENKQYRENARKISQRFKDRPLSALDTAMFWIEYVLRHDGAEFIKNPALKLNWISSNMLDVYLFVVVVAAAFIFVVVKLLFFLAGLMQLKNVTSDTKYKSKSS